MIVIHPSIWGPVFCLPVLWKGAGQVARAGPGSVLISPLLAKLQSQLRSHILILIVMMQHRMSEDTTEHSVSWNSWKGSGSFHFFLVTTYIWIHKCQLSMSLLLTYLIIQGKDYSWSRLIPVTTADVMISPAFDGKNHSQRKWSQPTRALSCTH